MHSAQMSRGMVIASGPESPAPYPIYDSSENELDCTRYYYRTPNNLCGFFGCGRIRTELTLRTQFFLEQQNMPSYGCAFISNPFALFSGVLKGNTFSGGGFDLPDAECNLYMKQVILAGDSIIASEELSENLVNVPEREWESRTKIMPSSVAFPSITFVLDRTQHLLIELEIQFKIDIEGRGLIGFSVNQQDPSFKIKTPIWSIQSLD